MMELIDFRSGCNDHCDKKTLVEACAASVPYIVTINESTGSIVLSYTNVLTGITLSTSPTGMVLGSCNSGTGSSNPEIIQGSVSPVLGSTSPTDSKLFYDTATQTITRANLGGTWVAYNDKIKVLTAVQPTPLATGNTTNLNTTFKDSLNNTWIVDSLGNAVQAGSAITLDGNDNHVVRANSTVAVAPTLVEIPTRILGDTANVFLLDNTVEYWTYNGTTWVLSRTIRATNLRYGTTLPTVLANDRINDTYIRNSTGNSSGVLTSTFKFDGTTWYQISGADEIIDVTVATLPTLPAPTIAGATFVPNTPNQLNTLYSISDGVSVIYAKWNGTNYITSAPASQLKIKRIVQALVAGSNVITYPAPIMTSTPVMVEVEDNVTGEIIARRKIAETTTSVTISVAIAVTSARITIVGQ